MGGTMKYVQRTGVITDEGGHVVAIGWAGHDEGRNNPDMQDHMSLGPLPVGKYKFGPWGDHETVEDYPAHLGPMISSLIQVEGETFGRSGFFMHGPGGVNPLQSSRGCIEVYRPERNKIHTLDPEFLEVVSG